MDNVQSKMENIPIANHSYSGNWELNHELKEFWTRGNISVDKSFTIEVCSLESPPVLTSLSYFCTNLDELD